ncbi:conserved hypothetical protein [Culex quinquefasciatus]|uniref:Cilia- and flagella-associated protein 43 n=1 Tax=Culex quinquefasciatus TaxID=7176 RepID=B0W8J9_CULQU|nr:conserved hypothetical protein [Culex quinquefasciatus]|eukprot:XP_001845033.1 conserved hypothetical protein [Culex quinquefasciatus]
MGTGCHILLVNVNTQVESFYRATDRASGEGVSCLNGHKSFNIYAFAESCPQPRIFIVAYPDNSVLFVLEGDDKTLSYISLCFSESEYLVALTGLPDYCIEVYVWRNKELLIRRKTEMQTEKQSISCSPASMLTVCQLAYSQAQITLWEVHGNVRLCRLIEKPLKLPFGKEEAPLDGTFLIDGTLMVINRLGSVYSFSATSGQANQIIKPADEPGPFFPRLFYCKGGLFLSDTDGSISFHKRQKGVWNQLWNMRAPETFTLLLYYSASDELNNGSDNKLTAKICSTIKVKHQVQNFQISVDQFHMTTWSIDGLVTIYETKSDKLLAYFIAHDRNKMGAKLMRCDLMHQYIFSLGHNNSLVCFKMHRSSTNAQRYTELKLSLETDDVASMFMNPTKGFTPKGFTFTRWIDMEKISRLESEKLDCEPVKLEITKDFKVVRTMLRDLLDANEIATEEEQLPIQAFNLNASVTEHLKEMVCRFLR